MSDLLFQALTYESSDEDGRFCIRIFGKTESGRSVCLKTAFTPYFFIEILPGSSKEGVIDKIRKRLVTINKEWDEDDDDGSVPKWIDLKSHLMEASEVKRMRYWGFENGKQRRFVRFVFRTYQAMQRASRVAENEGMDRYEANIHPVLRLLHIRKLQSTGWVKAQKVVRSIGRQTTCDIEASCRWDDIFPGENKLTAPFVLASWDIESMSTTGGFPDPSIAGDVVFQIATTFQRFGEPEPYLRHIVNLGSCDSLDGVELQCAESEKELMQMWVDVIRREQTDVLVGYNIYGFDFSYLWKRATRFGFQNKLQLGRVKSIKPTLKVQDLQSAAYGQNKFELIPSPGVYQIDLYVWAKRELKLDSYRLDAVAETYLGEHKLDVTPQDIFRMFTQGPAERKRVAEYCVQVGALPAVPSGDIRHNLQGHGSYWLHRCMGHLLRDTKCHRSNTLSDQNPA